MKVDNPSKLAIEIAKEVGGSYSPSYIAAYRAALKAIEITTGQSVVSFWNLPTDGDLVSYRVSKEELDKLLKDFPEV